MDNAKLIKLIERIAKREGFKPSTVCQYALNNSRVYDTTRRASENNAERAERLRAWADARK